MKYVWFFILGFMILVSGCSNDNDGGTNPDASHPSVVQDLSFQDSTLTLTWTAPGDDGTDGQVAQYDIRYSASLLTEAGWDSALIANPPPLPKPAGQVESLLVSDLIDGTWHFGLKAADEVPNWSEISNIVRVTINDTIPSDMVTDLAATFVTMTSIKFTWTAPEVVAGEGQASGYVLRYALEPITEETWDDAIEVEGLPAPDLPGTIESFTVGNLESGTTYSFALRAIDEAFNLSTLSNVVNRSTAYIERLTFSPDDGSDSYGAMDPIWSPDGSQVAFNADWGSSRGSTDLYIISASGGEPERLTNIPDRIFGACWSPDGEQMAFATPWPTYTEIYIMDANPGSGPERITNYQGTMHIIDLLWSAEGDKFAFVSDTPLNPSTIYTTSTAGEVTVPLTNSYRIDEMDWSPDGNQLVFQDFKDENYDIWTFPVLGGHSVRLTYDPARDRYPAWSPDGSQIAFVSNRSGDYDIWVMSMDGTNPTQLTFDSTVEFYLSWSPDGTRIAFSSSENGIYDIRILVLE